MELPTPCYLGSWVQYQSGSLKYHKHWFFPNDLSCCIGGTMQKYVVAKPQVPTVWPIQEDINLTQKEVTTLKKIGFSFWLFKVYLIPNLLIQATPMCLLWIAIALWSCPMQVVGL